MKINKLIRTITAVAASITLLAVTVSPISNKSQVYHAVSSRVKLDEEDFTVNYLANTVRNYSGAVYFNPSAGHLLYSNIPRENMADYGLKLMDADNKLYIVAPKLTSSVTYSTDTTIHNETACIYAVTDKTSPNNLIRKETYIDPSLAIEGQPITDIYVHKLIFKDGSVAEFNTSDLTTSTNLTKGLVTLRRNVVLYNSDGSRFTMGEFGSDSVYTKRDANNLTEYGMHRLLRTPDSKKSMSVNSLYFSSTQYLYNNSEMFLPEYLEDKYQDYDPVSSLSPYYKSLATYFNFNSKCLYGIGMTSELTTYTYYDGFRSDFYRLGQIHIYPKSGTEFEIQADIDALTEQVANLNTKIISIKADTEELTGQLNSAVAELNNIKGTLQTSGVDTTSLTTIQNSINKFKNKITTLTQQKAALETEKTNLTSQITALTEQVNNLQTANQSLNDQVTQLTLNLGLAENSITSLNATIGELNTEIASLEDNLLEIKVALGLDSDATQAQIITKINELKTTLETYEDTINTIGTTLGSENPNDIVAMKQQADTTVQNLNDLRTEISNLKIMIQNLGFTPATDIADQLQALIDTYNEQVNKLATYTNFINTLIGQLDIDSNASLSDILAEIANLQDLLQQHKDAVTTINSTLDIDSASSLQDTKDTIAQRTTELNTLNNSFADVKNKLSLYLAINNSLPTEREQVEQAINDFTSMYDETIAEANRLLTFLQDCQTILSLDSSSSTVDILNRIRSLQQQLTLANQKIEGYDENVNQMVDTLNLDRDSLSTDKISVVNYQTSQMKKNLNDTKSDLSTLQSELASITGVAGTSQAVQDLVDSLNSDISNSLSKVNELTSINSSISKALGLGSGANLDEVLGKIDDMYDEMADLNKNNADLTDNNNVLTGQNQIYDQDNSYLKSLTDNQLKELYELLKKVDSTTTDSTTYDNIITRISEMETLLNSKIYETKSSISTQISDAKTELSTQINNTRTDINSISSSVNSLSDKVDNNNTSVLSQLSDITNVVNNITTDQGDMETRLNNIESQLSDIKELLSEVSDKQDNAANELSELKSKASLTNQSTDTILEKIVPYNLGSTLQENNSILSELITRDVTISDTSSHVTSSTPEPSSAPTETPAPAPSPTPTEEPKPIAESISNPTVEPTAASTVNEAKEKESTLITWLSVNKLLVILTVIALSTLITLGIYFIKKRDKE